MICVTKKEICLKVSLSPPYKHGLASAWAGCNASYMLGNPRNFFLWNPGNFAYGMWNPGFWNLEYSSRNPESHCRLESRIQVLLTNTGTQYLESGIHIVESRIQDCHGFPYMGRYEPTIGSRV